MSETKTKKNLKDYWSKFMSLNGASVFVAMIAVLIIFEIYLQLTRGGSGLLFVTPSNLLGILRQQYYVGIIAFGLTFVMITGNIDLSIGSMFTMMCCVTAMTMMKTDSAIAAIVVSLGVGALCGLFNGVLVSYLKLNSFITTLGSSSIFTAIALMLSAGTILVIPDTCDPMFKMLGTAKIGPISILIVWFVVVAVILGYILSRTVFGKQLYVIGANPVAARYSGIKVNRNTTIAYVITGVCVGLAALIVMANTLSSNPQTGSGEEMDIILAVVLGGVAINGGKGSVWGTIIGVLFTGVLAAGFTQMDLNIYVQWVLMGLIMVFALSTDALKGKGGKLWKRK